MNTDQIIVLNDYSNEIDLYINKVKSFNSQVEKLRPVFNDHVDGIGIVLNSTWVKKIVHGNIRTAIGESLHSYLLKQPKFLRRTIDKSFYEQVDPLYDKLTPLLSAHNALQETYPLPYEIRNYFEFTDDGTLNVGISVKEDITQKLGVFVKNEKQYQIFNSFQKFYNALSNLMSEVDENVINEISRAIPAGYSGTKGIEGVKQRSRQILESIIKNNK
ncbi:MAG TPA: hypothetical protein DCG77_14755 [Sphingobacterium sp.]|nr:hypothetical protein [Sphingobacterium sp.]